MLGFSGFLHFWIRSGLCDKKGNTKSQPKKTIKGTKASKVKGTLTQGTSPDVCDKKGNTQSRQQKRTAKVTKGNTPLRVIWDLSRRVSLSLSLRLCVSVCLCLCVSVCVCVCLCLCVRLWLCFCICLSPAFWGGGTRPEAMK